MSTVLKRVVDAAQGELSALGFQPSEQTDGSAAFTKDDVLLTMTHDGEVFTLTAGTADEQDEKKQLMAALVSLDASDSDIKYVCGELCETLRGKYGEKSAAAKPQSKKKPQTVSKNAVKKGSFYDCSTLASRLCTVFPELRELHRANIDKYGEFFEQEFFTEHATDKIIAAIEKNNPATMKKLFQILNEIYEDGTNEVQSLIAVTILGKLNNNEKLLARCVDYMSETMAPPVIEVNRFLATPAGKKAARKLENPPKYKPKKKKKQGFFSQMMAQQGAGPMPPV